MNANRYTVSRHPIVADHIKTYKATIILLRAFYEWIEKAPAR